MSLQTVRRNSFGTARPTNRNDIFIMKVMRLPNPIPKITLDSSSLLSSSELSAQLSISANLGALYLGETFRACISILHRFPSPLRSVSFKIEVQTSTARHALLDATAAPLDFLPDECRDFIVQHTIVDCEDNNLVCSATYMDDDAQRLTFQKFFILKVDSPVELRPALFEKRDVAYAELRVTSLCSEPLVLEKVAFHPGGSLFSLHPQLLSTDTRPVLGDAIDPPQTQTLDSAGTVEQLLKSSDVNLLQLPILDSKQSDCFVWRLDNTVLQALAGRPVGSFCLHWCTSGGKSGVLWSKPVFRSTAIPDVLLSVDFCPTEAQVETPFDVHLRVSNNSARPLDVRLSMSQDRMHGLLPFGVSTKSFGTVLPRTEATTHLQLLPVSVGPQQLSGFTVLVREVGVGDRMVLFDNLGPHIVVSS